ncbi:MAG: glycosyltransferase family 39 protein [Burkholderiaceae bacterium]|jgi:4-amino-4-deoxy-L-arabinose transferase-like glycosyltransferase|nr:glycosyltransferase family 39 protein [Burkholderiaceae bacterium]
MRPSSPHESAAISTFIAHPLAWLLLWAIVQALSRVWSYSALELDEAEQMLWTQQLALGYGKQPPLYTWLQWGVNQVFGPSVWSLAALKAALLALTYGFTWAAARESLLPPKTAWWTAASLMWLPLMGWESLRDLTHSVLLNCLVAATWYALARQIRRPRPGGLAWLGLALGLGALSKYNFALFAGALAVSALSLPAARSALLMRGWWLLPLIAGLVVAPHGIWLLEHWPQVSQAMVEKLHVDARVSHWAGLSDLVLGLASNLLPWAVAVALVFGCGWRAQAAPASRAVADWVRPLIARYLLATLTCLLLMVFVGQVSQLKVRWLHPLVSVVPWLAFASRPALEDHPKGRFYTWSVVALAIVFWAFATARPWLKADSPNQINEPVIALADALRQAGYDGRAAIIADNQALAGMLRTRFAQARITFCRSAAIDVPAGRDCVRQAASASPAGWLQISRDGLSDPHWWLRGDAPQTIDLPYLNARGQAPRVRYHFLWQPRP